MLAPLSSTRRATKRLFQMVWLSILMLGASTALAAIPTVTSISPSSGPPAGGTSVTITGTDFIGLTGVRFGGTSASSFNLNSATSITATSPASSAGVVDVTVTTAGGTSITSSADQFTYLAPSIVITPTTLPGFVVGVAYSQTITASAGTAPYSYIVSSGSLPAGLTLTSGGTLSGTPTAAVPYSFTVRATDANSYIGVRSYSGTVTAQQAQNITFVNPGTQNFRTTPTLTASSTSGLSVSFTSSTFAVCTVTSTGSLTFFSAGSCTINADQVGDSNFLAAPQVSNTFTVNAISPGAPTIGTATAGNGSASVAFTAPANNGGSTITSYTVTSSPGNFTGTGSASPLTVAGLSNGTAYTFTVRAINGVGTGSPSASSTSVTPSSGITLAPASLPGMRVGTAYSNSVSASGGTAPYSYLISSGSLPAGITLSSTGLLSGTPTSAGAFSFTVQAQDNLGSQGSQSYSGAVLSPVLGITPASPALSATVNTAYTQTFEASGGTAPYRYNAVGTLPAGLTLNSTTGQLSGTPTTAGSYAFTINATDASTGPGTPFTIAQPYTLEVGSVLARSDPSKDLEVQALISAQASSSRRFAVGQISNFQQRLEALHNGSYDRFSNGFNLTSASLQRQRPKADPDSMQQWLQVKNANAKEQTGLRADASDDASPALRNQPGTAPASPLAIWTAGTISVGDDARRSSDQDQDFVTSGLSAGLDYRWSSQLTVGVGFGYGHDKTDIGDNGSRTEADSYSVALYGSYRPVEDIYLDAVLGYQRLSFDNRRYIIDNGSRVKGERDGSQVFVSLAAGYEYRQERWLLNPYLRLDLADARLDSYEESGDSLYALHYGQQTVDTSSTSLGVRSEFAVSTAIGQLTPSLRLEYQHDFQGAGEASMRYADLSGGPSYHANLDALGQDRGLLGLGFGLFTTAAWNLRLEYQYTLGSGDQQAQSLLFNLEKPF